MQNRKLQGDNIDELKYGAKGTSSEPDITSTGSVMEPRYFQRPLVASLSEAVGAISVNSLWQQQQQQQQQKK